MDDFAKLLTLLALIGAAVIAWRTLNSRRRRPAELDDPREARPLRVPQSFHIDRHPQPRSLTPTFDETLADASRRVMSHRELRRITPGHEAAIEATLERVRADERKRATAARRRDDEDETTRRRRNDDMTTDMLTMSALLSSQPSTTWASPDAGRGGDSCAAPSGGSGSYGSGSYGGHSYGGHSTEGSSYGGSSYGGGGDSGGSSGGDSGGGGGGGGCD